MAVDSCLLVVCLLVVVSTAPVHDVDNATLATRTLLAAAVFDGRVVSPLVDGRLLFRVRRVYKGWHDDVDRVRRVTRLDADVNRLIFVSCGSSEGGDSAAAGRGGPDGCRLGSAVVRGRYLVFATSFHAVVVGRDSRRSQLTPVGVYRTSGPLVPFTTHARRITTRYSNLSFGQYPVNLLLLNTSNNNDDDNNNNNNNNQLINACVTNFVLS